MAYLVILELRHVCLLLKPGVLIFIITFCRNQVTRSAMSRLFSIGIVGSHQDNSYFQIRESNKNVGYLFWITLIAIIRRKCFHWWLYYSVCFLQAPGSLGPQGIFLSLLNGKVHSRRGRITPAPWEILRNLSSRNEWGQWNLDQQCLEKRKLKVL